MQANRLVTLPPIYGLGTDELTTAAAAAPRRHVLCVQGRAQVTDLGPPGRGDPRHTVWGEYG